MNYRAPQSLPLVADKLRSNQGGIVRLLRTFPLSSFTLVSLCTRSRREHGNENEKRQGFREIREDIDLWSVSFYFENVHSCAQPLFLSDDEYTRRGNTCCKIELNYNKLINIFCCFVEFLISLVFTVLAELDILFFRKLFHQKLKMWRKVLECSSIREKR